MRVVDPALAAEHFNWLIVSIPLNHAMFSGDDRPPRRAQLKRYADSAVNTRTGCGTYQNALDGNQEAGGGEPIRTLCSREEAISEVESQLYW